MATAPPTRLIVNADDFGMTEGINRAVAELYDQGALTSATLMARGAAAADALRIARERPGLGVGCHVVLLDGAHGTAWEQAWSLRTRGGALSPSLVDFAFAVQSGSVRGEHIQQETSAQIAMLQDAGLNVTHVDTHKHVHLLPLVADAVLRGALARGVRCVRNPFEPAWCARAARVPLTRRLPFRVLGRFSRSFKSLTRELGMGTTEGCLGVAATGWMDQVVLQSILDSTPAGVYELVCHPGYNDQALVTVQTRLRASRETERTALLQIVPRLASGRYERISYAGLDSDR